MEQEKIGLKWKRVSSKRQKDEGASIEAQEKLISEYALKNGISIDKKKFEVDESAKNENRKVFLEMIDYMKKNPQIKYLLCEKTDRLLRGNLKDRVLIEELINDYDKEIHCIKEGLILGKNTKSSQKLHFDIQNALARHFLNNLSDEVKKAYDVLVDDGFYPHPPPLGYKSKLEDHLAIVESSVSPFILRAFELCSTGEHSEKQISQILYSEGFRSKKGNRVGKSAIGKILHDPFYYGYFRWKGEIKRGNHEPIITKDLYNKVQEVLSPKSKKRKGFKHDFTYTGLMTCGECGFGITAETQKGHIYYHCTKPRGVEKCSQKFVREEIIDEQIEKLVEVISLNLKKLEVIKDIMSVSLEEESQFVQTSLDSLNKRYNDLQDQQSKLLDLYLKGKIKDELYAYKSQEIEGEMNTVNSELAKYKRADKAYIQEIEKFLYFCNEVPELFRSSRPELKRELLRFVVSNLVLKDKKLDFELKLPFNIVAKYSENENWQGR